MKNKLFLLVVFFFPLFAQAQSRIVKGIVTSGEDQSALPGVNIILKGSTNGTVSDVNGNFSISVPSDDAVLTFSYVGYLNEDVKVGTATNLNVTLSPDLQTLSEVVVVGYGTQQKKDLTTSVASVDLESIDKLPIAQTEQALQGKVAGVQITQPSGKPGTPIAIRVRGATSITAGNDPLYVVDGMPTNTIQNINPADIASIDVLKDASSAAIYGARAANGVVLITTKQGDYNSTNINFNAYYGISQVTKKLDMLNSRQMGELLNDEFINSGQGQKVDPDTLTTNTNWQDEIFQNAPVQNYQLSFTGGSDKTKYFLAGGYFSQEGIIRPANFERYSLRLNLDQDVYNWLVLSNRMNFTRSNSKNVSDNSRVNQGGVVLSALSTPPFIGIYNPDGTFTTNPFQAWENPVATIEGPDDRSFINRLMDNLSAEITFTPGFTFKSSLGIDVYNNKSNYFLDPFRTQYGRSQEGIANTTTETETILLNENILNYHKNLGQHDFSVLAGMTTQSSHYESTYSAVSKFPNAAVQTLNGGARLDAATSSASEWALLSYLARLTYSFNDRYLMTANFRYDGSSRFGQSRRFAFFPSFSAGWRISEEGFMSNATFIDDLKLRLSYGQTGNQNIGNYSSYGLYALGANYPFGTIIYPGTYPSTIGNQDLQWESTTQTDLGLDISLFKSRLAITADAYLKKTNDLLLNIELPRSSGFSSGTSNFGKIENKGFELGINSDNLISNDINQLQWSTNLNFSLNRNKVLDLGGQKLFDGDIPENGYATIVEEGKPLGSFFGYVTKGVDPETGNLTFQDISGDGEINDDDRVIIGNANPKFIYGLGNTLSFKGFDLYVLFQGVEGNDVFNATRIETEGMFHVKNATTRTLNRWRSPGDITDIPKAVFGDPDQNSRISNRFIEDGSFLRLKNVALTYNFPNSLLEPVHMKGLSIYVSGQNLFTFTNYKGYDPEVNRDGLNSTSVGIDYGTYPQYKTYTVGLNITL